MTSTYEKFKSAISLLLKGESAFAVAVSGGSDSMALALLMHKFAQESGIKIIALTVDHHLRAESSQEAATVGKWLSARGIAHKILSWDEAKNLSNIHAKARKARYTLMVDFCASQGIKILCVGHTMDDQAETVLMRLMRGSGVDGLAAIAPSSKVFGIHAVKPLLEFTREELREYLRAEKQDWVNDPSNENTRFTRVKVRNLISTTESPELFKKRLAATATHMARAKNYIEEKIKQSLAGIFTFHNEGFFTVKLNEFRHLHEEERLRSLAAALQHISGNTYKTRFRNLEILHNKIMSGEPLNGSTLWGCSITSSQKKGEENLLFIYREPSAVSGDASIAAGQKINWDGRFACKAGKTGDSNLKVGALGRQGLEILLNLEFDFSKVQKKSNFIMPRKIIYSLPALWRLEKLLAVPHIGYYADENAKTIFECKAKTPPNIFLGKIENA